MGRFEKGRIYPTDILPQGRKRKKNWINGISFSFLTLLEKEEREEEKREEREREREKKDRNPLGISESAKEFDLMSQMPNGSKWSC